MEKLSWRDTSLELLASKPPEVGVLGEASGSWVLLVSVCYSLQRPEKLHEQLGARETACAAGAGCAGEAICVAGAGYIK